MLHAHYMCTRKKETKMFFVISPIKLKRRDADEIWCILSGINLLQNDLNVFNLT